MGKIKVSVDAIALREVLAAISGPLHLIHELVVISNLPGYDCPIKKLTRQFNKEIKKINSKIKEKDKLGN